MSPPHDWIIPLIGLIFLTYQTGEFDLRLFVRLSVFVPLFIRVIGLNALH